MPETLRRSLFAMLPGAALVWAQPKTAPKSAPKAPPKRAAARKPEVQLYPVLVDGKYGYIDNKGKMVIEPQFSGGSRFGEGLAAVQLEKAGKVGFIAPTGKMMIEPAYDLADVFSQGLAAVMLNHKWGYIDKTGKTLIPCEFPSASRFTKDGWAAVSILQGALTVGFTYVDPKGRFLNDDRFLAAMPFGEGLAAVRSFGEHYRFIDKTGKTIIPQQFITAAEFSEGLAPVETGTPEGLRWGYIDRKGAWVLPAQYFKALTFSQGLAPVQDQTGHWGFIDKKGKFVIPAKYEQAGHFENGIAEVWLHRVIGYIDRAGKYIWEPKPAEVKA